MRILTGIGLNWPKIEEKQDINMSVNTGIECKPPPGLPQHPLPPPPGRGKVLTANLASIRQRFSQPLSAHLTFNCSLSLSLPAPSSSQISDRYHPLPPPSPPPPDDWPFGKKKLLTLLTQRNDILFCGHFSVDHDKRQAASGHIRRCGLQIIGLRVGRRRGWG